MKTIDIKSQPFRGADGHVLNDYELAKLGLESMDRYEREEKRACNVDPIFRGWLKDLVSAVDSGESVSAFKARTIRQDIPLEVLCSNTERFNKKVRA